MAEAKKAAKKPAKKKISEAAALKYRVQDLEAQIAEMREHPPAPSGAQIEALLKANPSLVPEFLKPAVPIPEQRRSIMAAQEQVAAAEKALEETQKLLSALKRGVTFMPIGR